MGFFKDFFGGGKSNVPQLSGLNMAGVQQGAMNADLARRQSGYDDLSFRGLLPAVQTAGGQVGQLLQSGQAMGEGAGYVRQGLGMVGQGDKIDYSPVAQSKDMRLASQGYRQMYQGQLPAYNTQETMRGSLSKMGDSGVFAGAGAQGVSLRDLGISTTEYMLKGMQGLMNTGQVEQQLGLANEANRQNVWNLNEGQRRFDLGSLISGGNTLEGMLSNQIGQRSNLAQIQGQQSGLSGQDVMAMEQYNNQIANQQAQINAQQQKKSKLGGFGGLLGGIVGSAFGPVGGMIGGALGGGFDSGDITGAVTGGISGYGFGNKIGNESILSGGSWKDYGSRIGDYMGGTGDFDPATMEVRKQIGVQKAYEKEGYGYAGPLSRKTTPSWGTGGIMDGYNQGGGFADSSSWKL